jgi:glycosyltransferase involved in cell wall biosynthesis
VSCALAIACAGQVAVNARRLRVPPPAAPVTERVSVLLPARDEAGRIGPAVRALLAATGVPDLELIVYDDGSTDGTGALARAAAAGDPRALVLTGADLDPPPGWLGKAWACHRLAGAATGSVLVFVDADVTVRPDALARTVGLLRSASLDLVSPYPRQLAGSAAERLVQPLLQWSWLALLPLRWAERTRRPSAAVANGQLLCVDADAYRRAGGHAE